MKVWVPMIENTGLGTQPPFNIGCYSTREKAEESVLNFLKEYDPETPILNLETYGANKPPHWEWFIESYYLDDEVEA